MAFSGAITDTSTGINLTGNTNGTINFTGTLIASTGANTAFNATTGGTISATDANSTLTTLSIPKPNSRRTWARSPVARLMISPDESLR